MNPCHIDPTPVAVQPTLPDPTRVWQAKKASSTRLISPLKRAYRLLWQPEAFSLWRNAAPIVCLNLLIIALVFFGVRHTYAMQLGSTPFAWTDAGLTINLPAGWQTPVTAVEGDSLVLTMDDGAGTTIRLIVRESAELPLALETELGAFDLLPLGFEQQPLFGRAGWHTTASNYFRTESGEARAGLLPDDRTLIALARWADENGAGLLDSILNSFAFGIGGDPVRLTYAPVWTNADYDVRFLALAPDGAVYGVNGAQSMIAFDGESGAVSAEYEFPNPVTPTGIAVDSDGTVYVADIVCRCLMRLRAGEWIDPVGVFNGNAPLGVAAAPDGSIYGLDRGADGGYSLIAIDGKVTALNFNAAAPPLIAIDRDGEVLVVEWLHSLLDGSVSGAATQIVDGAAQIQYWLEGFTPDTVRAVSGVGGGALLVAADRVALVSGDGTETVINTPARSAVITRAGTLVVAALDGSVTAYSDRSTPNRIGAARLVSGIPVQGVLSESAPRQTWTYAGTAGETISIAAVDLARQQVLDISLDMALELFAPDGTRIGWNDDQLGVDLFGAYDAQITDVTLPESGEYTIAVNWVQGEGTYTLALTADQRAYWGTDGVIRLAGRLQDAVPVERWLFDGRAGQVLTLTLVAESGDLDPALELLKPDGSRLAYNDDTTDAQLDVNAQIARVRLPEDGTYVIEASRFDGAGRYSLLVVEVGA